MNLQVSQNKLMNEKVVLEASIRSNTEKILGNSKKSLEYLSEMVVDAEKIQDASILKQDFQTIASIKNIQHLALLYHHLKSTETICSQLAGLKKRYRSVSLILKTCLLEPLGSKDVLLYVHFELIQLLQLQQHLLTTAPIEVHPLVSQHFLKLDKLFRGFDKLIIHLMANLYELESELMVKMMKIIHISDERGAGNYKQVLFDMIHDLVAKRLQEPLSATDNISKDQLDSILAMMVDDLLFVREQVIPKAPPSFKLFPFFALEYHRAIYNYINKVLKNNVDAGTLLSILQWTQTYYKVLEEKCNIAQESLKPPLLDNQEQLLQKDVVHLLQDTLKQWIQNLLESETKEFLIRVKQPESDADGKYQMNVPTILFNIINQQIEVILSTNQIKLIQAVIDACFDAMQMFIVNFKRLVTEEYNKLIKAPASIYEGLADYLIAVANDFIRCADHTDVLMQRCTRWPHEVQDTSKLRLDEVQKTFVDASRYVVGLLNGMIIHDLQEVSKFMFLQEWYGRNDLPAIEATLHDYLQDFKLHLIEFCFSKLVSELMEQLVIVVLTNMKQKKSVFTQDTMLIRTWVDKIQNTFVQYKSEGKVQRAIDPLLKMVNLLTADGSSMFVDAYSLYKAYPDVKIEFLEQVLYKRTDIQSKEIKNTLESLKEKMMEKNRSGHTVFSLIT
eukprot:NODE_214_length_14327_cov_0.392325.p2 type:complete len:673 gc:universal NODE_214_length_14327_cov_0.392325:144-2162(+)